MPLTPVVISYTCDVCGIGEMFAHDLTMKGYEDAIKFNPPRYLHVCSNCGHEQLFNVTLPLLKHAKAGEELDLTQFDFEIKE